MSRNVAVIDLGTSNMGSLTSALAFLGVDYRLAVGPVDLLGASHVILPGVGAFDAAMARAHDLNLVSGIRQHASSGRPLLGVCLGMQLMFEGSDEGTLPGLAILPGVLRQLHADRERRVKVPHVGFSTIHGHAPTGLFDKLPTDSAFYFTHSFALPTLAGENVAWCRHSTDFVAAFHTGRICGAQFHPEKSQSNGLRLLSNFLQLS